jgi:hypothetical protein
MLDGFRFSNARRLWIALTVGNQPQDQQFALAQFGELFHQIGSLVRNTALPGTYHLQTLKFKARWHGTHASVSPSRNPGASPLSALREYTSIWMMQQDFCVFGRHTAADTLL